LIIIVITLFGTTTQVFAHATPIMYEPQSMSLLEIAPNVVRIHFSERIEPTASDIAVLGPDGTRVSIGSAAVERSDSRFFSVGMNNAGQGTYTVTWQVVSADDGHFTKGAFTFSVGKATAVSVGTAQIQIQHITTIPQATVMWIELLGQALLLGALLLYIGIWRPLVTRFSKEISSNDSESFERGTRMIVIAGIGCIIAGVISLLVLKTLDLEQLRGTAFMPTLGIFIQTLDGMHAFIRGSLALVFGLIFFLFQRQRANQTFLSGKNIALIAIMVGMTVSRARVSHSAATQFFPVISIGITAAHLFAKELWVGGLAAFAMLLLPILRNIKRARLITFTLISFSRIISIIFGVVGVSGIYIVWLDLKRPEYLFATEWGARFIILFILSGFLFLARLVSQLMLERTAVKALHVASPMNTAPTFAAALQSEPLQRRETHSTEQIPNEGKEHMHETARMTGMSYYLITFEMLIGLVLLFVTSFLIITTPPFPPTQFLFERHAISEGESISFTVPSYEQDTFFVAVNDKNNNPDSAVNNLIVRLTNEEKGIGPIVIQGEERFPGGYVIPKNSFSLPGQWQVTIIAQRPQAFDATASFTVNYPSDIDATRVDPEHYSFGLFEALLIMGALGIAGISWWLYRLSTRSQTVLMDTHEKDSDEITAHIPVFGKTFLAGAGGIMLIGGFLLVSYAFVIKTGFQKQCERDGNFWIQTVPMRDGAALSSDTVTGCTLNLGMYHFPDQREYAFFMRSRQSMVEITTVPAQPIAGIPTELSAHISSVERGQKAGPIRDIDIYHDRIAHVLIVGEDLKTFAHIHTEDLGPVTDQMKKDGIFPLRYIFPKAGRYTVAVNYVQGGKELSQQSFIEVSGQPLMQKNTDAAAEFDTDHVMAKDFDGYHVTFDIPAHITAGSMTKLAYTIEKDGKKLTDLEPYLGAAMHVAIVRADLGRVIHTHGQPYLPGSAFFQQLFQNYVNYHSHFVPDHFGPDIQARVAFPQPGLYEIFGEFKHGDRVITSSFTVHVE